MNTKLALYNLANNRDYLNRCLPFIKPEYFEGVYNQLFKEVAKFVSSYNKLPTLESFKIEVDNSDKFNDDQYTAAMEILPNIFEREKSDEKWLYDRGLREHAPAWQRIGKPTVASMDFTPFGTAQRSRITEILNGFNNIYAIIIDKYKTTYEWTMKQEEIDIQHHA